MKLNRNTLELYAVTDKTWLDTRSLADDVKEAIKGGVSIVQLREKEMDDIEFIKEGIEVKKVCNEYDVPLIINDNLGVMLKLDADGIHVGQSDMDALTIRKKIGKDKILGVSCQTVSQAKKAQIDGADYIGVGAVFPTSTKSDAADVSKDTLKEICECVNIPVVAIGGITYDNICELKDTSIAGIAVVSAIFKQKNIKEKTELLLQEVRKITS